MKRQNEPFTINSNKGFQLRFKNGWTVSVQFGPGNYCSHYGKVDKAGSLDFDMALKTRRWESKSAEIAAFKGEKWFEFSDGDTVKGYVTSDTVAKFIACIASKKS